MIVEMRVQDYAVISDVSLELAPGFNALSGETGAGKSIIVGALSLVLGARASRDVVRAGSARAVVESLFDTAGVAGFENKLHGLGCDGDEGHLILRREVWAQGRNRAWVNGSPATVGVVGELAASFVDIHGQHEHQSLSKPTVRAKLLDAYGGSAEAAARVAERFREAVQAKKALAALEERVDGLAKRADYLRFQLREIERVDPRPGEEEELLAKARRLQHAQELARGTAAVHGSLYEEDDSVTERLAALRRTLERLADFDPALAEAGDQLAEAAMALEETGRTLGDYATGVDHDPAELSRIRDRLDEIHRLKRKYGPRLEDVLAEADGTRRELSTLDGSDAELLGRRRAVLEARTKLQEAAEELSRARKAGSARLGKAVQAVLPELGMEGARFSVALQPREDIAVGGAERVDFRVSTNPGFAPAPMHQVASGGELSRLSLALKAVLAKADRTPVLVFDEVDAGVGGGVAARIGALLAEVAEDRQVVAVTHLAQVAARASAHLVVEKSTSDEVAKASMRRIEGADRVAELARMLGGVPESAVSLEHARELLEAGARRESGKRRP